MEDSALSLADASRQLRAAVLLEQRVCVSMHVATGLQLRAFVFAAFVKTSPNSKWLQGPAVLCFKFPISSCRLRFFTISNFLKRLSLPASALSGHVTSPFPITLHHIVMLTGAKGGYCLSPSPGNTGDPDLIRTSFKSSEYQLNCF